MKQNVMKTQKTTIELFADDAMTLNEMNFIKGGGTEAPIDFIIPPPDDDDDDDDSGDGGN